MAHDHKALSWHLKLHALSSLVSFLTPVSKTPRASSSRDQSLLDKWMAQTERNSQGHSDHPQARTKRTLQHPSISCLTLYQSAEGE